MCVVLHVNVGIFSVVDFILFYYFFFSWGVDYIDSGINITQPLPPLTWQEGLKPRKIQSEIFVLFLYH